MGCALKPVRIASVVNYQVPQNVKQMKCFPEMVGWYARFLEKGSELKVRLLKLFRKGPTWTWGKEEQEAFEALKSVPTKAPILARPNFSCPFVV